MKQFRERVISDSAIHKRNRRIQAASEVVTYTLPSEELERYRQLPFENGRKVFVVPNGGKLNYV
jgi:hypothetical protein